MKSRSWIVLRETLGEVGGHDMTPRLSLRLLVVVAVVLAQRKGGEKCEILRLERE